MVYNPKLIALAVFAIHSAFTSIGGRYCDNSCSPSNLTDFKYFCVEGAPERFTQCLNGVRYSYTCGAGLTWHTTLKECNRVQDPPSPRCNCYTEMANLNDGYCGYGCKPESETDYKYYCNEYNPRLFAQCVSGHLLKRECEGIFRWNQKTQECTDGRIEPCTCKPMNPPASLYCDLGCKATGLHRGVYCVQGEPTKFSYCSGRNRTVAACDWGQIFDDRSDRCQFGGNYTGCTSCKLRI